MIVRQPMRFLVWSGRQSSGTCLGLAALLVPILAARTPNIVFLYADDQASWSVGALGNSQSRTPAIDRLYAEGMGLINAFTTTPVCSPSRAGMIASRYGTEIGITDYLNHSQEPDNGLDPNLPTWPKLLQAAGYKTAFVGKWHLGVLDQFLPTNFGYDRFYGFRVGGSTSKDPQVESEGVTRVVEGYTPDILTDEAIRFVRSVASEPFLLSLHFWAPHANTSDRTPDGDRTWLPLSNVDWNPFRQLDVALPQPEYPGLDIPRAKRMMAEYLGSVASLDRNVGRLLAVLDELGIEGNTIVVFTSDHGFNMGHNGIWHKGNGRWLLTNNRGYRSNMYDHSIRVPAVVRWPDRIPAASKADEIILNLDWFPTILAMAGIEVPASAVIRGESFLPVLERHPVQWRTSFYGEYRQLHQEEVDLRMWRTPEWKLVQSSRPGMDELYNLRTDPGEHTNLAGDASPEIRRIRSELETALSLQMQKTVVRP